MDAEQINEDIPEPVMEMINLDELQTVEQKITALIGTVFFTSSEPSRKFEWIRWKNQSAIYWYALKEIISETELRIFTGYRDFDDGHSIHFRCSCKECTKSAVFNLRYMTFTRLNAHTDKCYAPKYRSKLTTSVPKSKRISHKKTIRTNK